MTEKYKTREERRKLAAQEKRNANKKNIKKPKSLMKKILLSIMIIGIVCLVGGIGTLAYFISDAPKLDEKLLRDPIASKIKTVDGELIAELGKENRDYINFEDIPETVREAFLATEDNRFFDHNGVDFLRFGSAVFANITDGFGSQGGSTLTQQVVKRSFLTPDKTAKRKIQEMWLAIQLERKFTKEEIFEMYVNKIWFANNANGILTASKTYYGKDLDELELDEVAMLVGLPQSPSRYDPFKYPERAEERRNVVLHLMNRHGYITEAEMKEAQSKKVADGLIEKDTSKVDSTPYDAFIDLVIEEVQSMGDYNIFSDGLEIYTTIDKSAQEYVYKMLNTNEIINYPNETLQAGITLLDTKTGEIKAIGGGRNTTVKRGWNYATDTKRSPGSTIKPIIDYGPAVEYLNWSTYQQVKDEPYSYSDGTPLKNASNRHYGTMTVREALGRSLNIPAVKTLQEVGLDRAKDFTKNLGIPFVNDTIVESSAIGGGIEISTLELAGAYGAFGNGGIYNKPHTVKKIILRDKTEVKNKTETKPVMKDSTAFIVTNMLKSVLTQSYGTGQLANIPGLPVAGKTGSTNYDANERAKHNIPSSAVKDSWMAGYTTNYTISVWVGYNNNPDEKFEYVGTESQRIPKYLFKNLMQHVSQGKQTPDFVQPDSVAKVDIVKGSNPVVKANQFTPKDKISTEYYVKGHEPTQVTTEYTKIDAPTNPSATYNAETNEILVSWGYPEAEQPPTFEVTVSIDGGAATTLTKSKDMSLSMRNPTPGSSYTFSIKAIIGDQSSDSVSATVQIPGAEEEETPPEEVTPPEGEQNPTQPGETPPNENENGNSGNNGGEEQNPATPPNRDDDDDDDTPDEEDEE